MRKNWIVCCGMLVLLACQNQSTLPVLTQETADPATFPEVICGTLHRIDSFPSEFVVPRTVDIWLPENYSEAQDYAVLYMHDGQGLYDASKTWNEQAWDVDDTACRLLEAEALRPFIVVGIWNPGVQRHPNYFPQQPFDQLPAELRDSISRQLQDVGRANAAFQPNSDDYLRFVVEELKPYIDQQYAVQTGPEQTFMAGSSMGGLISLYAICEYPEVFSGVACLSTHWPGTFIAENPFPKAYRNYLSQHLPDPATHSIYFDYGDATLDSLYPPLQRQVDAVMRQRGYTEANWETRFFPGKDHSERSWRERFELPLQFLLTN